MGFSGYYQYLCIKGHYWEEECDYGWGDKEDEEICYECGEDTQVAWHNLVDTTNGSWDPDVEEMTDENRIDGYVKLEEKTPAKYETCQTCKHRKLIEPATYKIPKDCRYGS